MRRLVVVLLLAAACSGGTDGSAPAPEVSSPSPSASPSAAPTGALVLEVDGLGVSDGAASITHFPFATTTAAQVEAVVSRMLGSGKAAAQPECGQGPRSSYQSQGLTLLLNGPTWVGWTSEQQGLTTADGIGVGVTRAAVEGSGTAVTFSNSSLGTEFSAENSGFGGVLSGPGPKDTVTTVYSGETCFFR